MRQSEEKTKTTIKKKMYIYIYIYINVKTTQTNPIIQQHTSKDTSTHAETDDRQESSNVFPNLKTIQIYM